MDQKHKITINNIKDYIINYKFCNNEDLLKYITENKITKQKLISSCRLLKKHYNVRGHNISYTPSMNDSVKNITNYIIQYYILELNHNNTNLCNNLIDNIVKDVCKQILQPDDEVIHIEPQNRELMESDDEVIEHSHEDIYIDDKCHNIKLQIDDKKSENSIELWESISNYYDEEKDIEKEHEIYELKKTCLEVKKTVEDLQIAISHLHDNLVKCKDDKHTLETDLKYLTTKNDIMEHQINELTKDNQLKNNTIIEKEVQKIKLDNELNIFCRKLINSNQQTHNHIKDLVYQHDESQKIVSLFCHFHMTKND